MDFCLCIWKKSSTFVGDKVGNRLWAIGYWQLVIGYGLLAMGMNR